jgi:hypothetical protein
MGDVKLCNPRYQKRDSSFVLRLRSEGAATKPNLGFLSMTGLLYPSINSELAMVDLDRPVMLRMKQWLCIGFWHCVKHRTCYQDQSQKKHAITEHLF